jgi:hypothetical protein
MQIRSDVLRVRSERPRPLPRRPSLRKSTSTTTSRCRAGNPHTARATASPNSARSPPPSGGSRVLQVVKFPHAAHLASASMIPPGVDNDAKQPCLESRFASKGLPSPGGLEHRFSARSPRRPAGYRSNFHGKALARGQILKHQSIERRPVHDRTLFVRCPVLTRLLGPGIATESLKIKWEFTGMGAHTLGSEVGEVKIERAKEGPAMVRRRSRRDCPRHEEREQLCKLRTG